MVYPNNIKVKSTKPECEFADANSARTVRTKKASTTNGNTAALDWLFDQVFTMTNAVFARTIREGMEQRLNALQK